MLHPESTSHRQVEEALASSSIEVRQHAARVAAEVLPPERLVAFVAQGEDYARRAAAMEALAFAGRRALQAVIAGVRGGHSSTALFCVQVLGRIDAHEARAVLREMALEHDLLLAQAAVEALGIQRDPDAVPLLLGMIDGERELLEMDPWRAISAIIALGQIGDPSAIPGLLRLRASDIFRDTADEAVAAIRRSSRSE
jgi:HEAT repeat protein